MSTAGLWNFSFRNLKMEEQDLDEYQKKLLEIRDKYKQKAEDLDGCYFYTGELPPPDNIFATFKFECKRHTPKCTGWYLIWNPNLDINKEKLKSSLHNHCTLWQYKALSKKIQLELEKLFEKYFEMFDDDDTHPYYIDAFYNLNYGFKTEDDELPDYTSYSLEDRSYESAY